jgi:hypothetical protein
MPAPPASLPWNSFSPRSLRIRLQKDDDSRVEPDDLRLVLTEEMELRRVKITVHWGICILAVSTLRCPIHAVSLHEWEGKPLEQRFNF